MRHPAHLGQAPSTTMVVLIIIIHIIRLLTMPQTHCSRLSAVVLFLFPPENQPHPTTEILLFAF